MPAPQHPIADLPPGSDTGKVVSARNAGAPDSRWRHGGDRGFVGIGFAENIAVALEQALRRKPGGGPAGRRLAAQPDPGLCRRAGRRQERGLNHLGHDGLVAR